MKTYVYILTNKYKETLYIAEFKIPAQKAGMTKRRMLNQVLNEKQNQS